MIPPVSCRPLNASDVDDAVSTFAATFHRQMSPGQLERLEAIANHFLRHDPGGCWAAEVDGQFVGFALSARRGDLWVGALMYVRPDRQSSGVGRLLFQRILAYGAEVPRGMFTSTGDPRGTRLYVASGFTVHPTMFASGQVKRAAIPRAQGVSPREADLDDLEFMTAVDRQIRGTTRVADLEHLISDGARGLVTQSQSGRGYVVFRDGLPPVDGVPLALAATDPQSAQDLLWAAIAEANSTVILGSLTSNRQWAIHVALRAGLRLMPGGALYLRGMDDAPRPWLLSDVFG